MFINRAKDGSNKLCGKAISKKWQRIPKNLSFCTKIGRVFLCRIFIFHIFVTDIDRKLCYNQKGS